MKFAPVSEETAAGCFPKGEYEAVIKNAVEKTSKAKGNPMIEVELTVYGADSAEIELKDWLVCTDGGQRKIQRFCRSADLWGTYEAGELCADSCIGLNVTVKLKTEEDEEYGPRNKVADYMPRKAAGAAPEKPASNLPGVSASQRANAGAGRADPAKPPTGDDIPF